MNRKRLIFTLSLVTLLSAPCVLFAQPKDSRTDDPKYGATPEIRQECLKNTSFYSEYYKQKNFKDAIPGWSIAYTICPQSSQNLYIRGLRIIRQSIEQEVDPTVKATLIDSMLRIYDKKIQYFKREGYNLALKAIDLYALDPSRLEEVAEIVKKAHSFDGDKVNPQAMLILMQVTKDLYTNRKRTADQVIEVYSMVSELFARQLAAFPSGAELAAKPEKEKASIEEEKQKLSQMTEALDALFTSAGVANCDNLISIYTPKFEKDTANIELARNIRAQLAALRCTDSELFLAVSIKVFQREPTAAVGGEIARMYQAKHQNALADRYFRASVDAESDSVRRSALLVEYASFVGTTMGELARARTLANEAIALNPKQGYAYLLLGTLYASTRDCGSSKLDRASVYWAAVDKFAQAKSVQPDLAAECNKQISYYSQYFPTSEEIFFQDYEVGKAFTVPCWINERTTIRAKN